MTTNQEIAWVLRDEAAATMQAVQRLQSAARRELCLWWPVSERGSTSCTLVSMLLSLADYFERQPNAANVRREGQGS